MTGDIDKIAAAAAKTTEPESRTPGRSSLPAEHVLALTELTDDESGPLDVEDANETTSIIDDILQSGQTATEETPEKPLSPAGVSSGLISTATPPKTSLERSGNVNANNGNKVGAVRVEGSASNGPADADNLQEGSSQLLAETAPTVDVSGTSATAAVVPDAVLAEDVEEQIYNKIISKAAVGEVVGDKSKDKKTWIWIAAVVLGLALIIGLSVGLTRDDRVGDDDGVDGGEGAEALLETLETASIAAFGDDYTLVLSDPESPQYQAFEWMSMHEEFTSGSADSATLLETYAISTLYFATGESSVWKNDNPRVAVDPDVCSWLKEEEHCQDGYAVTLDVSQYNLTGTLPQELYFLEGLETLDVHQNTLTGEMPSEFLSSLMKSMNLSYNDFQGDIPSFGSNLGMLQSWDISHNAMVTSTISDTLFSLPALKEIRMDHTGLTGSIASDVGLLQSLEVFSAEAMSLEGSFPSQFASCQNLTHLNLAETVNVTGSFPYQMWSLPMLKSVNIKNVGLTVQLPNPVTSLEMIATPSNAGTAVTDFYPKRLEELVLTASTLEGNLPSEIGYMTLLQRLELDAIASLTGTLPTEIGMLGQLQKLDFSRSSAFAFTIPTEIGLLTNMEEFWMFKSGLEGSIPSEIGTMSSLREFNAKLVKLGTSIPSEVGLLTNLEVFEILLNSGIYGTIPTELGLLTNLHTLTCGGHNVTGTLPSELGNLQKLEKMIFAAGQIGGTIPASLGRMRSIIKLAVDKQMLIGTLPDSLSTLAQLTTLDFKENLLTGTVPRVYADLTNLRELRIEGNMITGPIDTTMCAGWNHNKVSADCDELERCECCSLCCVDGKDCVEQDDYVPSSGESNGFFPGP